MPRVVILGRGGAGKSTLARRIGRLTGLPVLELDQPFWNVTLQPLTKDAWSAKQMAVARDEAWVMDGDLGPYDVLVPRLQRADTIVMLDIALWRQE